MRSFLLPYALCALAGAADAPGPWGTRAVSWVAAGYAGPIDSSFEIAGFDGTWDRDDRWDLTFRHYQPASRDGRIVGFAGGSLSYRQREDSAGRASIDAEGFGIEVELGVSLGLAPGGGTPAFDMALQPWLSVGGSYQDIDVDDVPGLFGSVSGSFDSDQFELGLGADLMLVFRRRFSLTAGLGWQNWWADGGDVEVINGVVVTTGDAFDFDGDAFVYRIRVGVVL